MTWLFCSFHARQGTWTLPNKPKMTGGKCFKCGKYSVVYVVCIHKFWLMCLCLQEYSLLAEYDFILVCVCLQVYWTGVPTTSRVWLQKWHSQPWYQVSTKLISGSGDSLVVRASDLWLKGSGFKSQQERRENFLLQGQLFVLTLILVSVPPLCYRSSM